MIVEVPVAKRSRLTLEVLSSLPRSILHERLYPSAYSIPDSRHVDGVSRVAQLGFTSNSECQELHYDAPSLVAHK